jgi:hypothetical protein
MTCKKNLQKFMFWKIKLIRNKIIMSSKKNLIIITGSAKEQRAQNVL